MIFGRFTRWLVLKNVVFFADYISTLFFDTNDRKIFIELLNFWNILYGCVVIFRSCDQENNVACLIVTSIIQCKHHVPTVYLNRIVVYYDDNMTWFSPSLFWSWCGSNFEDMTLVDVEYVIHFSVFFFFLLLVIMMWFVILSTVTESSRKCV